MCFVCSLSAEVTANISASEETLSWLLDIIENDPDPYIRSARHALFLTSFPAVSDMKDAS